MSEMVDRVARAIREGRGCDGAMPCSFCLWGPDERTSEWDETGCIWLARAAIQAMRELPNEMLYRGAAFAMPRTVENAKNEYAGRDVKAFQEAWYAMIDEALK